MNGQPDDVTMRDLVPLHTAMGELRGQIGSLTSTVTALTAQIAVAQQTSSDEHAGVSARLDSLQRQLDTKVATAAELDGVVRRMVPLEADLQQRAGGTIRARTIGGLVLGCATVGSVVSGIVMQLAG